MINLTTYEPTTGRMLLAKMVGSINENTAPGGHYVDGIWDTELFYVISGIAVPRPPNPTNVTGTTLFNIPLPAQLGIDDGNGVTFYEVTDGTVELNFPLPGSYLVVVRAFPCVDATFRFDV